MDPVSYPRLNQDIYFYKTSKRPNLYPITLHETKSKMLHSKFGKAALHELLRTILPADSNVPKILKPVGIKLLHDYIYLLLMEGYMKEFDAMIDIVNATEYSPNYEYKRTYAKHSIYKSGQVLLDYSKELIDESFEWPTIFPIKIVNRLTPPLFLDQAPLNALLRIEFTIPVAPINFANTKRGYFVYFARLHGTCEGMDEYFECKKSNEKILNTLFTPTKEELSSMILISDEEKKAIQSKKDQFSLFSDNTRMPNGVYSLEEREAMKKSLKYPLKKLKPTIQNIKWECTNQHTLQVNKSYINIECTSIKRIPLDNMVFGGGVNVLLIEMHHTPLENIPSIIQIIEADVDVKAWNAANVKPKENVIIERSLSLCCPVTTVRMETPVRSHACNHLECFDRTSLASVKREEGLFECPICKQTRNISDLIEPSHMKEILGKTDPTVKEVVVNNNTLKWRVDESLMKQKRQRDESDSENIERKKKSA